MKILDLVLKKQWFDMIKSGIKHEEYREIKPYWTKRFLDKDGNFKPFTHIKFHNGYTSNYILFRIENMSIGKGKPEWGGDIDNNVYIIKFTDRQLKEEFKTLFKKTIDENVSEYYIDGKVDIDKLNEIYIKNIRKLFKDDKLEFTSNNNLQDYILYGKDEYTNNILKMISD